MCVGGGNLPTHRCDKPDDVISTQPQRVFYKIKYNSIDYILLCDIDWAQLQFFVLKKVVLLVKILKLQPNSNTCILSIRGVKYASLF